MDTILKLRIKILKDVINSWSIKDVMKMLNWKPSNQTLVFASSNLGFDKFIKSKLDFSGGVGMQEINSEYFMCDTVTRFMSNKLYFPKIIFVLRESAFEDSDKFVGNMTEIRRLNNQCSPDDFEFSYNQATV